MKTDVVVSSTIANVRAGHVLIFVEPLWGMFVYVGAMVIAFGGVLSCLRN